jgi:hypothetical protein
MAKQRIVPGASVEVVRTPTRPDRKNVVALAAIETVQAGSVRDQTVVTRAAIDLIVAGIGIICVVTEPHMEVLAGSISAAVRDAVVTGRPEMNRRAVRQQPRLPDVKPPCSTCREPNGSRHFFCPATASGPNQAP